MCCSHDDNLIKVLVAHMVLLMAIHSMGWLVYTEDPFYYKIKNNNNKEKKKAYGASFWTQLLELTRKFKTVLVPIWEEWWSSTRKQSPKTQPLNPHPKHTQHAHKPTETKWENIKRPITPTKLPNPWRKPTSLILSSTKLLYWFKGTMQCNRTKHQLLITK